MPRSREASLVDSTGGAREVARGKSQRACRGRQSPRLGYPLVARAPRKHEVATKGIVGGLIATVFINGEVVDGSAATISVFDRGFLYGDSVYETMRTVGGRPVDLDDHLDRLSRSAKAIALKLPEHKVLKKAVRRTLEAAGYDESNIRVVVTRGVGAIGLATDLAKTATHIVIVRPLELPAPSLYERGAKLALVGVQRTPKGVMDPGIKSGNYLNNIMALHEARRVGADEALMCNLDGVIAECSTSNVFLIRRGEIVTPPIEAGLLAGITRRRIIELAEASGIAVVEASMRPHELGGVDEVFITSSIRGVLPVAEVVASEFAAKAPGPVTVRVMELYRLYLAKQAGG